MRNFIFGFIFGTSLFVLIAAGFDKPKIVGNSGKLDGIEVIGTDGRPVCEDPAWLEPSKQVSCE